MPGINKTAEATDINYYSSVKSTSVQWLWYPYIPYGKITVLQGDPGDGKSTMILDLIGKMTTGSDLPDGSRNGQIITCVYQCSEDSVSDTIKPRLIASKADCSKVAYIFDEDVSLTLDDMRIEKSIADTGARLLVLDPVQSFLTQESEMQNAVRIRCLLKKLNQMAKKYSCAVLLIGHMNKAEGRKQLYRGLGSIDIAASARSVLMIERDSVNKDIRYLSQIKSNLAPEGETIAFRITENRSICWLGRFSSISFDEERLLAFSKSKKDNAKRLINIQLEHGEIQSSLIIKMLHDSGLSERTINTAKKELNIKTIRKKGAWYWRKPEGLERKDV